MRSWRTLYRDTDSKTRASEDSNEESYSDHEHDELMYEFETLELQENESPSRKTKRRSKRIRKPRWSLSGFPETLAFHVMLYIAANYAYKLSLQLASTPKEMNAMLGKLGSLIGTAAAIFSIQLWLSFVQRSSTQSFLLGRLLQIANFVLWYLYDSGNILQHHGSYNLLIFCLIFLPLNIIIGVVSFWYVKAGVSGETTNKRFWKQFVAVACVVSIATFYELKLKQDALGYGFFGHEIPCSRDMRDAGTCDSCQWKKTVPWFDLLPFRQNFFVGPMTCKIDPSFSARFEKNQLIIKGCDNQRTEMKSYFDGSVLTASSGPLYSVLPRTESWGLSMKNDSLDRPFNGMQDTVLHFAQENTWPYQGPVDMNNEIDSVLVHCGKHQPKLVYRILPISLPVVKEKATQYQEGGLNVVTLFIDAMSRNHFHRRLPKTKKALEALTRDLDHSPAALYEFWRYHSVGMNTLPNTRALWAGLETSNTTSSGKPIWEQFEDSGYVSARVDPMCQDWSAYYNSGSFARTGLTIPMRLSHEHIAFGCMPPQLPIGKSNAGNFAGPASIKARCFSGTHLGWHILDWIDDFINTYQGRIPYHANAAFMEAHEGSGEVLRTLDERLANFLDPEMSVIDFEKTAIVIVSDHGALMGLNNAFFENGHVEAKNPFAAMILPRWYVGHEERAENLENAAGELVTPYDIYETIRGFMGRSDGTRISGGKDLMREHVGSRTCKQVGISEDFCICR